jgi:hypothetical protein
VANLLPQVIPESQAQDVSKEVGFRSAAQGLFRTTVEVSECFCVLVNGFAQFALTHAGLNAIRLDFRIFR